MTAAVASVRAVPRSAYLWSGAGLALMAAVLLVLSLWTDLDLILADSAFDRERGVFSWRDAWFAAVFMHLWVKVALVAAGTGVAIVTAVDALHPLSCIPPWVRTRLRIVALCALAIPLAVGAVALTTGLGVAAMVKAFGIGFLARPRSQPAADAREAPVAVGR